MSNPESNLHAALMAKVEVMATALGYDVLYPQKGGDAPAGEHVRAYQLPNDNEAAGISSQVYNRQGFLVLTLVSPMGEYEVVTKDKAGAIAAYFPRGPFGASGITIQGHTVKQGREEGERWETPIWIEYWSQT